MSDYSLHPETSAQLVHSRAVMQIAAPLTSESTPVLQRIEVATSLQIPNFFLIGLVGPEVQEARERVRAAIEASGFEFPRKRVVINLSPANIRKRGTGLDLAMALGVLATNGKAEETGLVVAWGELGLDGRLKPAGQPTRALYSAWRAGARRFIFVNEEKAKVLEALDLVGRSGELTDTLPPSLYPVSSLAEAWNALTSEQLALSPSLVDRVHQKVSPAPARLLPLPPVLERAVTIAASGRHHLLITGAKGMGKSHALDWLIALQPRASAALELHHRLIQELSPLQNSKPYTPCRRVGAHVRPAALVGSVGGGLIRPGEFSLAHGGLLIADEFPEWARDSREALREPLERGTILLSRAEASLELPAQFVLAANGNLCPCGGFPGLCLCHPNTRKEYVDHLSGPLLDRIDLAVKIDDAQKLRLVSQEQPGLLERLRAQVESARERAIRNWGTPAGLLDGATIEGLVRENPSWSKKLGSSRLSSLRSRHKMIRIALSLAAWDGQDQPTPDAFLEAERYRPENVDFLSRKEA